jgi:hypothetical protein
MKIHPLYKNEALGLEVAEIEFEIGDCVGGPTPKKEGI